MALFSEEQLKQFQALLKPLDARLSVLDARLSDIDGKQACVSLCKISLATAFQKSSPLLACNIWQSSFAAALDGHLEVTLWTSVARLRSLPAGCWNMAYRLLMKRKESTSRANCRNFTALSVKKTKTVLTGEIPCNPQTSMKGHVKYNLSVQDKCHIC